MSTDLVSSQKKIAFLESQLMKTEKKIADLSRIVNQLSTFKQTVVESLKSGDDALNDEFSSKHDSNGKF